MHHTLEHDAFHLSGVKMTPEPISRVNVLVLVQLSHHLVASSNGKGNDVVSIIISCHSKPFAVDQSLYKAINQIAQNQVATFPT